MKMRFSDRIGKTKPKELFQKDYIDSETKNLLWNLLTRNIYLTGDFDVFDNNWQNKYSNSYDFTIDKFLKKPLDSIEIGSTDAQKKAFIKIWYFEAYWYEIYNFIEFVVNYIDGELIEPINDILKTEKSAYRFSNGKLVPITDEVELSTVSDAIALEDKFSGAREHIKRALDAFSRKPVGDYLTAIKEAISAVESISKIVSKKEKASLGDALNIMDQQKKMHPAFKESFLKLYGYASDEKGIRHALLDDKISVNEADAHFMIVVCSAFLNFVVARHH